MINKNNFFQANLPKKKLSDDIQRYIYKYWKKKHILSKNNKLFYWQHCSQKNKVDFLINQKNKKIYSILGVINQSRDSNYSEISLAIWHTLVPGKGLSMMLNLIKLKKIRLIKLTTIGLSAVSLYRKLGFSVNNFNQYYITNLSKNKQVISSNLKFVKICNSNYAIPKLLQIKDILKKKVKNKKYLEWRFVTHPIYTYYFLESVNQKLILICRVIKIKNETFLKIVDFIGSFEGQREFVRSLRNFLKIHNMHHIEFLHYGYEDKFIKLTCFKRANNYQILPIFTQPFVGLKKQKIICGYLSRNKKWKVKLVTADGDSDRPST